MARPAKTKRETNGGANLGFEAQLLQATDKMRGSRDASEYKNVALSLIFLKHISDDFEATHIAIKAVGEDPENRDFYIADNLFWVTKEARWNHLQGNARQPSIGKLIDLINGIGLHEGADKSKDILGRVYEYFLSAQIRKNLRVLVGGQK